MGVRPRSSTKEPIIQVLGHVCREIRVHQHDLNFAEFDSLGTFLVVGSSEHGKMFLCDTKTSPSYKLAPAPLPQRGGPRKSKFKPSFDSPNATKKVVMECENKVWRMEWIWNKRNPKI